MNTEIIRADYDELAAIAARFGKSAQVVTQMQAMVRRVVDQLQGGGWVGQGADSFFKEMEGRVLPAGQRLQEAMAQAQRVTALISHILQEADEEAANPFRPGGAAVLGALMAGWGQNFRIGVGLNIGIGAGVWGPNGFNPALGAAGGGLLGGGFGGNVPSPGFFQGDGLPGGMGTGGADYGIPQNWLDNVTNSLQIHLGDTYNDYGIPQDWLSGVTEGLGGVNDWGIPQDWLSGVDDGLTSDVTGGNGMGSDGDMGAGSGGGNGGGSATPETTPTEEPPASGGGSGGGSAPETNVRSPYGNARDFRMGSGATSPAAAAASGGQFLYQSLGGGASGGAAGGSAAAMPAATAVSRPSMGGTATAPAATGSGSPAGVPFGIAAASPFVALLGKAVQSQFKDKDR